MRLIKTIQRAILKIITAFRCYRARQRTVKGLAWRCHIKAQLMTVVVAWRTRRALNCLSSEIQQFVNCETHPRKHRLRQEFHLLFDKILSDKLYLAKNARQLKRL